jgi:hypothetical protein
MLSCQRVIRDRLSHCFLHAALKRLLYTFPYADRGALSCPVGIDSFEDKIDYRGNPLGRAFAGIDYIRCNHPE